MHEKKFLTPAELSERWGGRITTRTLANWRSQAAGPPFVKIGGAVLYDCEQVAAWEKSNTVTSTSQYRAASA
ncbi:hypothetical protein FHR70_000650 [Microvirga lupini]|uniref:DNA-binding protein n=1 Tax=Microvirga lupini TaxID=420324 RepID=A0A7W4VIX9_9HYPH|nr:DNA-binding protein [Microvirga lupini]MBB3017610.1 hypothetical protein [Microvirga lupini]